MITLHTNFGDIKIALNHEKAPVTAENFLTYCKNGFYDKLRSFLPLPVLSHDLRQF